VRLTEEEYQAIQARNRARNTVKKVAPRSKYGAVRTQVNGITFDSKGEAERYMELLALQEAGQISDLRLQVRFPLVIQGEYGTVQREYRADFVYVQDGHRIVEDYKGHRTREYQFKRDLMRALHGIEIKETGRVNNPRLKSKALS